LNAGEIAQRVHQAIERAAAVFQFQLSFEITHFARASIRKNRLVTSAQNESGLHLAGTGDMKVP
jgi:hypothetical protein